MGHVTSQGRQGEVVRDMEMWIEKPDNQRIERKRDTGRQGCRNTGSLSKVIVLHIHFCCTELSWALQPQSTSANSCFPANNDGRSRKQSVYVTIAVLSSRSIAGPNHTVARQQALQVKLPHHDFSVYAEIGFVFWKARQSPNLSEAASRWTLHALVLGSLGHWCSRCFVRNI